MEIGTTDTSELHSVKALLDSGVTGSFIDRDFVHSKGINTWTLSCNIPVFNVDGSPNEAGQISEVVDILPLTPLVPTPFCKYKWEKRLPKLLLISALNM